MSICAAHLGGDSNIDLVVASRPDDSITVFWNNFALIAEEGKRKEEENPIPKESE